MSSVSSVVPAAWATEAFSTAHRTGAPVLLLIGARWSSACRRFAGNVLGDAAIVDLVSRRFVAVAVDVDRRPDIAARYALPERDADDEMLLPTVLCLTADGEVLSGGGEVDAPRLMQALAAIADTVAARREEIARRARDTRRTRREQQGDSHAAARSAESWPRDLGPGSNALALDVADVSAAAAARLTQAFDATWAGFGEGAKRPHVSAVALALGLAVRTGDDALREMAVRTLDRLGWSDLSDARTGAFHRLCRQREWTAPDTARLLGVQAELAGLFLDAAVMLDERAYADRARAALDYTAAVLADPAGGFFESEAEDDGEPGSVDRVLITSSNARMVRTLLRAAEVLHAPRYGELAMQTIERLAPAVYAQSAGVAHYLEHESPRVRGLLVDQVETSAALLDLAEASGNRVYLELSEELMRGCMRKLWAPESGGFLDRLRSSSGGGDIGRLGDPLVPVAVNCLAARVLARLARETGGDDLREHAASTLTAIAPHAFAQGLLAADYAVAHSEVAALIRAPTVPEPGHQGSKQS